MENYQLYTEADILATITAAPSKSCELDPIPTDILKQFLPEMAPHIYITKMCNASLSEGMLPTSQRSAVVTTRLKKSGSDQAGVGNYRPISNLTFMSKVVECLVNRQLVAYLEQNGQLPELQSAYSQAYLTKLPFSRWSLTFYWQLIEASHIAQLSGFISCGQWTTTFLLTDCITLLDSVKRALVDAEFHHRSYTESQSRRPVLRGRLRCAGAARQCTWANPAVILYTADVHQSDNCC